MFSDEMYIIDGDEENGFLKPAFWISWMKIWLGDTVEYPCLLLDLNKLWNLIAVTITSEHLFDVQLMAEARVL